MKQVYISLLRGINVSGQNKIAMQELRQLYASLELGNIQTYVQSGNVIFTSEQADQALLAQIIEARIKQQFGYTVPVFIRDAQEFERMFAGNPFLHGRDEDPAWLHVTFLYETSPVIKLLQIPSPNPDGDEFVAGQREIFLFCPNGYGRTKLSNSFFERKLKVAATTRNWKTVHALTNLAGEMMGR